MDAPDIYNPQELGRRQQMADVRRQREVARRAVLRQLLDRQRQALELKTWISACLRQDSDTTSPEFQRMIEWASGQLEELERALRSERITEALQAQGLFPKTDPLYDQKGEPSQHRIWGHSFALRHINAV
ncbi:hypothetical protein [Shinella zoogloeoides]|uniref:hypothetical protein n=1 Tax=Shinella zoogloeoides TaxID=352475 RepID=UPI00299F4812|nr:hypothetical protein [Shinella zoogloeoides]WPE19208.1 hypothetical protein ShzoTeo12_03720 [Shinella zoogloeoides]